MQAIAQAESGCVMKDNLSNTETHNGCTGSYGKLQVGCIHYYANEDRSDFKTNVKVAHRAWKNRPDYTAWTMFNNGEYRKYLK